MSLHTGDIIYGRLTLLTLAVMATIMCLNTSPENLSHQVKAIEASLFSPASLSLLSSKALW